MIEPGVIEDSGRWLGLAACLASIPLWLVFLARAAGGEAGLPWRTALLVAVLVSLALVGAAASWRRAAVWMLAVALVSFLPVGLYLPLTEGLTQILGGLHLALLVAAAMVWWGRAGRRGSGPNTTRPSPESGRLAQVGRGCCQARYSPFGTAADGRLLETRLPTC